MATSRPREQSFTLDVRGSATSVVRMLGSIVLVATVLSILAVSRNIATRTLPANRFRRSIRLGRTGVGLGLTFTLALAVFRVVAPEGRAPRRNPTGSRAAKQA